MRAGTRLYDPSLVKWHPEVSLDFARIPFLDWHWTGLTAAVSILLASVLIAFIAHKLLFPLSLRIARRIPSDLDSRVINATRWPLNLGIIVLGGYLAVAVPDGIDHTLLHLAERWIGTAALALGVLAMAMALVQVLQWYLEGLAGQFSQVLDSRLAPLLRRVGSVLIYGLAGLLVLDLLSINISPLIAGLGLGGLAVALAIQPTLSNLFAGTYVMTEGVVSSGDYIQLEGSVAGYVVDVGWRSTRIRTWTNNLVVIPNSKFADTIITNYNLPQPPVNIFLTCGVSYDSDLFKVERVCQEIMDQVLEEGPDGVEEYGGWFGFDSFGDSNVNFWLFLQAKDRLSSFTLQSTVVQKVHERLREEGIVINYPMRTVQIPGLDAPVPMSSPAGDGLPRRTNGRPERRRRRRSIPKDLNTAANGSADAAQGDPGPSGS